MTMAVGIDSHKESLAAASVDELGRTLEVRQFANDGGGHDEMLAWVRSNPDVTRIGIEDSGVYGAALCPGPGRCRRGREEGAAHARL